MAGQTPRFALNFFGGTNPGALDDDAYKYTGEDRLSIDRILHALEQHNHRPAVTLTAPSTLPDLSLSTDGALDAGSTYYYRVSFVNADGLETVAGPEATIDTPALLDAPPAPTGTTSTSTGVLDAGLYYYAVSGIRDEEESALGSPVALTVLIGENTVTLELPDLEEATTYQVWRMRDVDPGWTRIGTTDTGDFLDDGSVPAGTYGDPANVPPIANTGVSNYAVTLTLTGADLTRVSTARSWRIYRTDVSGAYSAASLVHDVVETDDEDDPDSPLMTSWLDDGDAQLTGSPNLFSTELQIPSFTFDSQQPFPAASGYPENYPMVDGSGVLFIARNGVWAPVSGARGVALYNGSGDPTGAEPSGAQAGDIYLDIDTGDVYVLDGL